MLCMHLCVCFVLHTRRYLKLKNSNFFLCAKRMLPNCLKDAEYFSVSLLTDSAKNILGDTRDYTSVVIDIKEEDEEEDDKDLIIHWS